MMMDLSCLKKNVELWLMIQARSQGDGLLSQTGTFSFQTYWEELIYTEGDARESLYIISHSRKNNDLLGDNGS